jgi:aspartyl-tRNA(Asn)/glutamyl-tRNA(Gln) amidotransferase subunit B
LGVKSELKNLNSFKAVRMSLDYEIERQSGILEKGEKIIQETRLWDAKKLQSFSMRSKEEAKDYRYFPEPDLPLFKILDKKVTEIKNSLPELPNQKKQRFITDYSLSAYDAEVLTISKDLADYFENCLKIYSDAKKISNWITGSFQEELNKRNLDPSNIKISPQNLIELIKLTDENIINNLSAKQVLSTMFDTLENPKKIVEDNNLAQISDVNGLTQACDQAIKDNSKSVSDFISGKDNALMFLVGQVMRQTKGKANPKIVAQLLTDKIKRES